MQLQSGPLLGSLLSLSPDVWPGSGYMALQFLAFFLNWLRKWWCQVSSGLSAWQEQWHKSGLCWQHRQPSVM